jgi:hypothetical protein
MDEREARQRIPDGAVKFRPEVAQKHSLAFVVLYRKMWGALSLSSLHVKFRQSQFGPASTDDSMEHTRAPFAAASGSSWTILVVAGRKPGLAGADRQAVIGTIHERGSCGARR